MEQGLSRHEASELVRLARAFRERRLLTEAIDLLQAALRIAPDDSDAAAELAAVRSEERDGGGPRRPGELLREQMRRDAIDAAHFLGLAHLYAEKGENAQALDCLEVARAKELADPGAHKLAGRIQFRRGQLDEAAAELRLALRWNPFDRETAELLGRVEFERGRREPALAATIHAFLLVNDAEEEAAERLRRRVRTLREILGWDSHALSRLFRERQDQLHVSFDRLQWRRERFLEDEGLVRATPGVGVAPATRRPGGRIGLAARLRRHKLFSNLSDEDVFQLTRVADEEVLDAGAHLFRHHDPERDLYLIARGDLLVQRTTGYGTFSLGSCAGGDLLGEVGFLTGAERSGDALAVTPLQLVRFERLLDDRPELAVQLYWTFWHQLAKKLRGMNAQLQSFFDPAALPENFLRLRRPQRVLADAVKVESSDKIRLFREQGLSRRELMTLATFSEEKRFPESAYVFQEGDEGRELYVILEGRVMICKYIPGGGEEALAILDRGEFFGEMSL
ncbi:MAG TPA: cyclic nucleotide-binding domain-containing protein, partial [Thermoanaerobaculia bacterium]|nr:cyclic nucleotide-binding domain-containing protein [Thermoanaerobaculia bacterium]